MSSYGLALSLTDDRTILHYPFTAFFVVFCNIISTRHVPDYRIMQQFVAYLAEAKDIVFSQFLFRMKILTSSRASPFPSCTSFAFRSVLSLQASWHQMRRRRSLSLMIIECNHPHSRNSQHSFLNPPIPHHFNRWIC